MAHYYQILIKHGDLLIDLSSDDIYFISKQMDKWLQILMDDSYVPLSLPQPPEPPAAAAPSPAAIPQPEPVAVPTPTPVPPPAPPEPPPAPPEPPTPPVPDEPPVQPISPPTPAPSAPETILQPEPVAATPPAPADFIRPEPPAPVQPETLPTPAVTVPATAPVLDNTVKDDFEAVMDSLMRDLEQTGPEGAVSADIPAMAPALTVPTREDILPEMAPIPAHDNGGGGKVNLSLIESLNELCEQSRATSSEDFLILTAYYLTYFDGVDKFSLKRINSLLVKSGLTPVNHSVLESSMGKSYLVMVPDLTGMADVSEYTLTEAGQQYANQLL